MTTATPADPPVSSYARLCRTARLQAACTLVQRGGPAADVDGRTLRQLAAIAPAQLQTIAQALFDPRCRFWPYAPPLRRRAHRPPWKAACSSSTPSGD